jgi:hypothetical protein
VQFQSHFSTFDDTSYQTSRERTFQDLFRKLMSVGMYMWVGHELKPDFLIYLVKPKSDLSPAYLCSEIFEPKKARTRNRKPDPDPRPKNRARPIPKREHCIWIALESNQCDQIGRNFADWAHFFVFGRIMYVWNISPNWFGRNFCKIAPKYLDFDYFLVYKFIHLNQ